MQIAITSQNRKTITEHAGKCRKFWLYDIELDQITSKRLVELPIEQSFHASHHGLPEALSDINVLISGGMGGTCSAACSTSAYNQSLPARKTPTRPSPTFSPAAC